MKVLLLVAGGRAGSGLFHSLLDEHSQILQFPGILEINKNILDLIKQKNHYEIPVRRDHGRWKQYLVYMQIFYFSFLVLVRRLLFQR